MKRMKRDEIKQEAMMKYMLYVSHFGMWNGKRIVWQMYKLFRAEEKRRKAMGEKI